MKLLSSLRPRACPSLPQSAHHRLLPQPPTSAHSRLASSNSSSKSNSNSSTTSSSFPPLPHSPPTSTDTYPQTNLPNNLSPTIPPSQQDSTFRTASRASQSIASSPSAPLQQQTASSSSTPRDPNSAAYSIANQFRELLSPTSYQGSYTSFQPQAKPLPHQKPTREDDILREVRGNLQKRQGDIEAMVSRKWQVGDVYTPHDLSPVEMMKWKKRRRPERDVLDLLGLKPLDEWKNPKLLAEYMTSMGRIKHPKETGLRPVNQRKIAKAIRRAVGMGFMPSTHAHPELLRRERTGFTYR